MIDLIQFVITWFSDFASSELFRNFALFFVFLYAGTPSFVFLPNEFLVIPAYVMGVNPVLLVIAVGLGGFLGDTGLYYFAHHVHKKVTGNTKNNVNHMLYKYKHFVYVISPNLFFGFGDVILIFSGIRHIPFRKIAPFLLAGNLLRGLWGMVAVIYGIQLFDFLL